MLKLDYYPSAIANAANSLNELEAMLINLKTRLAVSENAATAEVAFDLTLKNDKQRDIRRYELLCADDVYQDLSKQCNRINHEKANALTYLDQLRNEFSVAKLQVRQEIVQQLTSIEVRELVGI
jgi:hypothetical protein